MDEYIKRDKAIDKLRRRKALFCKNQIEFKLLPTNDKSRVDEIDACIAMLINMLSADVQPVVHGEWVGAHAYCDHLNEEAKVNGRPERYLPSGMVIGVYCNQCWCRADKKSDFCPSCCAKMDKRKGVDT